MELTPEQEETLKTLCEKHGKLSFRALEVMLVACAVAFLITKKHLQAIEEVQYVWVIVAIGLAAYKIAYSRAKTYTDAKTLQYTILTTLIYICAISLLVCQVWWIALMGLSLCSIMYFSMPNSKDMKSDFDDIKNAKS